MASKTCNIFAKVAPASALWASRKLLHVKQLANLPELSWSSIGYDDTCRQTCESLKAAAPRVSDGIEVPCNVAGGWWGAHSPEGFACKRVANLPGPNLKFSRLCMNVLEEREMMKTKSHITLIGKAQYVLA